MRRQGKGSGGGVGMNKNVRPKVKTGGANRAQSPCAVARQGMAVAPATRPEKMDAGKALPSKLGNELAGNVGGGGPGKGRQLYGQSGMQRQHGAAAGSPPREATPWYNDFPATKD
jgi:hypothetical protein